MWIELLDDVQNSADFWVLKLLKLFAYEIEYVGSGLILSVTTKDLRFYVELTRLLMEADENGWAEAPPDYIMWMLIRAKEWLAMASPNNAIRIPPVIARKRLLLVS